MKKTFNLVKKHNAYFFTWIAPPLPYNLFQTVERYWMSASFSPISLSEIKEIVQENNWREITPELCGSIRNIVMKQRIIKRHNWIKIHIKKIRAEYENGRSILELSHQYDYPPISLFRAILEERRNTQELEIKVYQKIIGRVFTGKADPTTILSGRDLAQYYLAFENDSENVINQAKNAKIAEDNERLFTDYFVEAGIKIRTQDELASEQIREYGRPIITPDLLFESEVYINDKRVYWLEFKDYLATNYAFLYQSNVKQVRRYSEKWGHGAICYRFGAVEKVGLPDVEILNAQNMPIHFISE